MRKLRWGRTASAGIPGQANQSYVFTRKRTCGLLWSFFWTKVGFEFSPGDKTYKTFEILLNDFSVSQIYGIIWKGVADASKLYLERGITKKHAANSVIGACERYAERAKMKGWVLSEYNRIRELPQSSLSSFFFNRVLGIGDMGFKVPPTVV